MSREARDWAWCCRGPTPALRCILLALAEHADEEGPCWPSLTRLAELTEVDRRTVTRGLAEGLPEKDYEAVIELNHQFVLGRGISIQPDIQYIVRPAGTGEIDNAFLIGARVSVNF